MKRISLILCLLVCSVAAMAQANPAHFVTIGWTASTDAAANPTGVNNIYRANGNCADTTITFAKIGSTTETVNTFTDSTVIQTPTVSTSYCYEITFVNAAGIESVPSNLVQAVILPPAPAPPTKAFAIKVQ